MVTARSIFIIYLVAEFWGPPPISHLRQVPVQGYLLLSVQYLSHSSLTKVPLKTTLLSLFITMWFEWNYFTPSSRNEL